MDSLLKQLNDVLKKIVDDVDDLSNEENKKAAQGVVQDLKNTSPRRTGRYAASWAIKSEALGGGAIGYTVYNKRGSVTHLLENGHVTVNGTGRVYPDTPSHKHIKPAEDRAVQKLITDLESKL